MSDTKQVVTDRYAIYNGDSIGVLPQIPNDSIHLSCYSPPFCGLYQYSSDPRDLSNCKSAAEFFEHYEFLVKEIYRVTMPGRMSAVHVADVPGKHDDIEDFPGDVIRLHKKLGWYYHARYAIWKEPLRVAIRTRSKGLTHRQLVKDSSFSNNAGADYVLIFRKAGENKIPISHPTGLLKYVGEREMSDELQRKYIDWKDPQTNKRAHWIWQQYASSFWDDIRISRVLPYKPARDKEEEKHVHPLQLDVVERLTLLWSNVGETVLTPFMGVGSEVYGAVVNQRKGIGIELKESYFRQAVKNIRLALHPEPSEHLELALGEQSKEKEFEEWDDKAIETGDE